MDYYQLADKKSLRGLEVVEGVDHLQNHRPEKTDQDLDQVGGIALNPLSLVEDLDYASLIMIQGSCSH